MPPERAQTTAIYATAPQVPIEASSIRLADASRLRRKGLDNGAVLTAGTARLGAGYRLEAVLNDASVGRILETTRVPGCRPR
jgi:uncharacterized membrane protein YgcG